MSRLRVPLGDRSPELRALAEGAQKRFKVSSGRWVGTLRLSTRVRRDRKGRLRSRARLAGRLRDRRLRRSGQASPKGELGRYELLLGEEVVGTGEGVVEGPTLWVEFDDLAAVDLRHGQLRVRRAAVVGRSAEGLGWGLRRHFRELLERLKEVSKKAKSAAFFGAPGSAHPLADLLWEAATGEDGLDIFDMADLLKADGAKAAAVYEAALRRVRPRVFKALEVLEERASHDDKYAVRDVRRWADELGQTADYLRDLGLPAMAGYIKARVAEITAAVR